MPGTGLLHDPNSPARGLPKAPIPLRGPGLFICTLMRMNSQRLQIKSPDTSSQGLCARDYRFYDYIHNSFEMLNILYSIQKFDKVNYGDVLYEEDYHTTFLTSRQLDTAYAIRNLDLIKAVEFLKGLCQTAVEDGSKDIESRKQLMPAIDTLLRRQMKKAGQTSDLVYFFGIGFTVLGLRLQFMHARQSD